jgi:hypothetical protein
LLAPFLASFADRSPFGTSLTRAFDATRVRLSSAAWYKKLTGPDFDASVPRVTRFDRSWILELTLNVGWPLLAVIPEDSTAGVPNLRSFQSRLSPGASSSGQPIRSEFLIGREYASTAELSRFSFGFVSWRTCSESCFRRRENRDDYFGSGILLS